MSALDDAFEQLLDAQEEVNGYRVKANINGKDYDFLKDDISSDLMPVQGGYAEGGQISGKLRASDFAETMPRKNDIVVVEGKELRILQIERINKTLNIIAGDPTASELD